MKHLVLAGVAFALSSVAALAADLPSRQAPPAPATPAPLVSSPAFGWDGFYLGLNAGAAERNGARASVVPAIGAPFGLKSGQEWGFVGGAHAGYNYQIGGYVAGAETDIQWGKFSDKAPAAYTSLFGKQTDNEFLGTTRARLGYAFGPTLLYGTGGVAYGNVGNVFGNDTTRVGWTLGAGAEYQFLQNWSVRAEYLYVNLDRKRDTAISPSGDVASTRGANDINVIRTGVSYKF